MKKLLFILALAVLPALTFAQGAGGQIKRPVKTTAPTKKPAKPSQKSGVNKTREGLLIEKEQNKNLISWNPDLRKPSDMVLKNFLHYPFGNVSVDMHTSSYNTIISILSESYSIDKNEDNGITSDLTCQGFPHRDQLTYCGFKIETLYVTFYHSGQRAINYLFEAHKSDIPDAYSNFEQIIYDFNQIGIPITGMRLNEKYDKAKAEIKVGNIEYVLCLSDIGDTWYLWITQKINY